MAYFDTGFLALLVLFAGSQNTASFEIPGRPIFPLASLNGSLVASANSLASGSFAAGGATCTDAFGAFPCSCLAISIPQRVVLTTLSEPVGYGTEDQYAEGTGTDESLTGTTVFTYGGKQVRTESVFQVPSLPDDCCESCEIDSSGVHILFWPVDDNNNDTKAQNVSNAKITTPYTTVSNGFTL